MLVEVKVPWVKHKSLTYAALDDFDLQVGDRVRVPVVDHTEVGQVTALESDYDGSYLKQVIEVVSRAEPAQDPFNEVTIVLPLERAREVKRGMPGAIAMLLERVDRAVQVEEYCGPRWADDDPDFANDDQPY